MRCDISQLDGRDPVKPGESTEGAERFAGDVCRPGGAVQPAADRQAAGDVEEMVVPVAETARQLHQRPCRPTQLHSGPLLFLRVSSFCDKMGEKKLSSIEDRDLTDRVATLPRPHALDSTAATDLGRATPHASPR